MSVARPVAERDDTIEDLDRVLAKEGFTRDWHWPLQRKYLGGLGPGGQIPVTLEISDLDFVSFPTFKLQNASGLSPDLVAHIGPQDGTLCYLDPASTVLDCGFRRKPDSDTDVKPDGVPRIIRTAFRE
jgi:hypothetical protein